MSTDTLMRDLEGSVAIVSAQKAADNPVGLRQKLLAIMRECDYIQKDKENTFHKYRYASEAAIKEKVHGALVKYGVLFQCDCVTFEERTGLGKEGKETLAKCQFHYIFEDVETGDKREGTFWGTGVDSADKHLYKAVTGAIKYILTTTFLIPTGDDPEEAPKVTKAEAKAAQKEVAERKLADMQAKGATVTEIGRPQNAINAGQVKRLYTMASEAKLSNPQAKLILGSYGFTSAKDVTVDKYDSVCKDIASCGLKCEHLPPPSECLPGDHARVGESIYRLSMDDQWEQLG